MACSFSVLAHTSVKCWEYTAPPEDRSRQGYQPGAGLGESLGSMADPILVLGRQLREAATQGRVEEERIIPETALPSGRLEEDALDHPFDRGFQAWMRAEDGDETSEPRRPALHRHARQRPQHDLATLGVAETRTAISRGDHTRTSAQSIHFDPGIVRQREL